LKKIEVSKQYMSLCKVALHLPHAVVKNVINIKSEKKIQALCKVTLHLPQAVENKNVKHQVREEDRRFVQGEVALSTEQ
jgi:hypothetical protein